jgi:hypothetical protein
VSSPSSTFGALTSRPQLCAGKTPTVRGPLKVETGLEEMVDCYCHRRASALTPSSSSERESGVLHIIARCCGMYRLAYVVSPKPGPCRRWPLMPSEIILLGRGLPMRH